MTKLLATLAIAAAVATPALAQKAPTAQIVTVDTQRIFSECNACKAAQTALQGQITGLQQRAQQLGQPLETEATAIRTALAGKQPDAAMQKRIEALQQKQQAAQTEVQQREQQVQRNRAFVSQQINQKLDPIFKAVMATRGANLMVDANNTLAASSALDVTADVLAQLNQQLPSVSTTAPAAAAPSR